MITQCYSCPLCGTTDNEKTHEHRDADLMVQRCPNVVIERPIRLWGLTDLGEP